LNILEFASRTLTQAERNWSAREREAFAIVWSVKRFEDYLKGTKFFVVTDHESLRWLESASTGKCQRWALYLQQFDCVIMHLQGRKNKIADWLSRSAPGDDDGELVDQISVPVWHTAKVPTLKDLQESFTVDEIPAEDR